MSTQSTLPEKFIPSLDGWRAVAILLVFVSHAGLGKFVPGGLGVTIFFFLSGYLITTLTCREFDRHQTISIKLFYARRALRLLPPLITTLLLVYTLTYLGVLNGGYTLQGFFSQLLYFANYYYLFFDIGNTTPAGTGILWSLSVEEHFYFIFPIIFILLAQINSKSRLALTLVSICLVVLVWRIYLVAVLGVQESRTYYATDTRIDSIIFGCLLALVYNPLEHREKNTTLGLSDYLIICSAVFILIFSVAYRDAFFRATVRYTLQGLSLAPLFFYSIKFHDHPLFRPLQWWPFQCIGVYSYSIYLIHYVLIERFHQVTPWALADSTLSAAIALAYAIGIDRLVDRPAHRIKARLY